MVLLENGNGMCHFMTIQINKIEEQEEGFSYKCSVFFKIRALRIICAIAYLAVPEMNLKNRKIIGSFRPVPFFFCVLY